MCTDVGGKVTYLNRVAESMTGWRLEEACGRPLAEVFNIIDGARRQTAQDPMELAVEQNRDLLQIASSSAVTVLNTRLKILPRLSMTAQASSQER